MSSTKVSVDAIQKRDKKKGKIAQEERINLENIGNNTDIVVFKTLREHNRLTRSELKEITRIPRSTLYDSLSRLILKGLVRKYPEKRATPGRPKVYYEITV